MSDKYPTAGLKPCPFCGQDVHPDYDFPQYVIHQTNKKGFNHSRLFMNRNDWNIRPIEDRLKARIAELEADVAELKRQLEIAVAYEIETKIRRGECELIPFTNAPEEK